jgi:hypothetical protein
MGTTTSGGLIVLEAASQFQSSTRVGPVASWSCCWAVLRTLRPAGATKTSPSPRAPRNRHPEMIERAKGAINGGPGDMPFA